MNASLWNSAYAFAEHTICKQGLWRELRGTYFVLAFISICTLKNPIHQTYVLGRVSSLIDQCFDSFRT